jgi:acyl-CoA dehydrogenase
MHPHGFPKVMMFAALPDSLPCGVLLAEAIRIRWLEEQEMKFELDEEHRMLADLVQRFVRDELLPLEGAVLEREASGQGAYLTIEERQRLDKVSHDLGLWSLDAPEDAGGMGLPHVALVAVNEALGSTVATYTLPPDSPNLRMLMTSVNEQQRKAYLEPYARGETISAIGISEPGAGADPAGMITRAVRDGDDWVINGRKIWITRAAEADFTILMAITDKEKKARGGMSAFLVDRDTPGFNVLRRIPMLGGEFTYEVTLEDCRVPGWKLLGEEGQGFGPMQVRLGTRRMEMAAWCIGAAQRALDMMREYAPQRKTFGHKLSERQSIQWWVADGATKIHAARLMAYDCAWKIDQGRDVRTEISMIKFFATEMAQEIIDNAMQCFGAMGMTKEMPLHLFAGRIRNMRIYDGPSEVHRMVVARNLMDTRP